MRAYLKNIWCYRVQQAAWFIQPGSPFLPVSYIWSVIESVYHSLYIYFFEVRDSILKDFHSGVLGHNTEELTFHLITEIKCFGTHHQLMQVLVSLMLPIYFSPENLSCYHWPCTWPFLAQFCSGTMQCGWDIFPEKMQNMYDSCQVFCTLNWWNKACYFHLVGETNIVISTALVSGLFISTAVIVQALITNKPTFTLPKKTNKKTPLTGQKHIKAHKRKLAQAAARKEMSILLIVVQNLTKNLHFSDRWTTSGSFLVLKMMQVAKTKATNQGHV